MRRLLVVCLFSSLAAGSACSKDSGGQDGPSEELVAFNLAVQAKRKVMLQEQKAYCACVAARHPPTRRPTKHAVEMTQTQCSGDKPKFFKYEKELYAAYGTKVAGDDIRSMRKTLERIEQDALKCVTRQYGRAGLKGSKR